MKIKPITPISPPSNRRHCGDYTRLARVKFQDDPEPPKRGEDSRGDILFSLLTLALMAAFLWLMGLFS